MNAADICPRAAFFCLGGQSDSDLWQVFNSEIRARIEAKARVLPAVVTPDNFALHARELREIEIIFATWGMWELTPAQLDAMPALKAVFYAAGSVKHFAAPLLTRGIHLTSSWQANAVPVAEFTLAQILLAGKGYFANVNGYRGREDYGAHRGHGNYGASVAVLGAGQIGRRVVELLRPHRLRVLCFDPFLGCKAAEALGVEKVELCEAFACATVVSNHLADVAATEGLLNRALFDLMPPGATFINTGRGKTVVTDDLVETLTRRPDLTALLDVTDPEPLPLSHPLRALPNAHLSSHIAGSIGAEVGRMADFACDEFERYLQGEPGHYAVTAPMLETMA